MLFPWILQTGDKTPEEGVSVCMCEAVEAPARSSHELFV